MTTITLPRHDAVLRDGSSVVIRQIHPSDAPRLVRFHRALTPETTRLRFFTFHPELSPDEVDRFTHVDHHDREAIVAIAAGEIVAVARFDRRVGDSSAAEVAFVVADSWQGRGLGGILFQELAALARPCGFTRFVADTLGDNRRMLKVFLHAGVPITHCFEDGVVHVTMELGRARMGA